MNTNVILVYEPVTNTMFDAAYAAQMKLPFHIGWDIYRVYDDSGNLIVEVDDYTEAITYLQ